MNLFNFDEIVKNPHAPWGTTKHEKGFNGLGIQVECTWKLKPLNPGILEPYFHSKSNHVSLRGACEPKPRGEAAVGRSNLMKSSTYKMRDCFAWLAMTTLGTFYEPVLYGFSKNF